MTFLNVSWRHWPKVENTLCAPLTACNRIFIYSVQHHNATHFLRSYFMMSVTAHVGLGTTISITHVGLDDSVWMWHRPISKISKILSMFPHTGVDRRQRCLSPPCSQLDSTHISRYRKPHTNRTADSRVISVTNMSRGHNVMSPVLIANRSVWYLRVRLDSQITLPKT